MDTNGIIRHARQLAAESGPGDPAATLLALATALDRERAERERERAAHRAEVAALRRVVWRVLRALRALRVRVALAALPVEPERPSYDSEAW